MCAHQHAACAHLGTQSHTLWAARPRTHTHASTAVRAAARCTATRARVPRRPATIRRRARPWELRIWSLWLAAALQQVRLRGSPARDIDSGSAPTGPMRRAFAVWRPLRFQLRASHARCVVDVAQRWGRPSRAVRRRACGQRGRRRGTRPGARASPSAHLSLALSARLFATREPRLRPQQPPRRHGSLCSSAPTAPRR